MRTRTPAVALAALCLAGCTPSGPAPIQQTGSAAAAPSLGPAGGPGCRPASPIRPEPSSGLPEVQATGDGRTAALGLLMQQGAPPVTAGDDPVKVVWRVTGSGPLTVVVRDPAGRRHALAWGPEAHGDSTYHRPGDEWGTGLDLSAAGCWHVALTRGGGTADVWLRVARATSR